MRNSPRKKDKKYVKKARNVKDKRLIVYFCKMKVLEDQRYIKVSWLNYYSVGGRDIDMVNKINGGQQI